MDPLELGLGGGGGPDQDGGGGSGEHGGDRVDGKLSAHKRELQSADKKARRGAGSEAEAEDSEQYFIKSLSTFLTEFDD